MNAKRKTGILLIGCGRAGMIHARNYFGRISNAYMAAVCDSNPEAARAAAEEFGLSAWYTDFREAAVLPDVDAVVIVSPTHLHCEIVEFCASQGKPIFCEKPMAITEEECTRMLAAVRKNNVVLQLGFMRRFDRSFEKAKALLDSGAIGRLVQIHSHTRGPSRPQPWMYDLKASNGILAEVNSHDIDSARWFAGSEIKRLFALGGNFRNEEVKEEWPDYYDSLLLCGEFENGVQLVIDGAAYVKYGYDAAVELVGDRGVIRVARSDKEFLSLTVDGQTTQPFIDSWRTLFEDAYLREDEAFIHAVNTGEEPRVGGLDGLMAVRIVNAGNEAIQTGRVVYPRTKE